MSTPTNLVDPGIPWSLIRTIIGWIFTTCFTYFLAYRQGSRSDRRKARDAFVVLVSRLLYDIGRKTELVKLWSDSVEGIKHVAFAYRIYLTAERTGRFDAALQAYEDIDKEHLSLKVKLLGREGDFPIELDYTKARAILSAPLEVMLELVK